jgi:hypothetical protein
LAARLAGQPLTKVVGSVRKDAQAMPVAQLVEPVANIDRTILKPLDSLAKLRILEKVTNVLREVKAIKKAPIKTIMKNLRIL